MKFFLPILFAFFCHTSLAETGDVLRTVAELNDSVNKGVSGFRYDVTVKMVVPLQPDLLSFCASDDTGTAIFGLDPAILNGCPTNAGDIVHVSGKAIPTTKKHVGLHSEQITLVSHGAPPKPIKVTVKDIYGNDKLNNAFITLNGVVYDAFRDEIDSLWSFIVLDCDGTLVYIAMFGESMSSGRLEGLIGATISVAGILTNHRYGSRVTLKRYITIHDPSAIKVLSPGTDPFIVPKFSFSPFPPSANAGVPGRRRIAGHVIAVWNGGGRILVRPDSGELIRADMKSQVPPRYGEYVEVSGFPATDLYRRNLSSAVWRPAKGAAFTNDTPTSIRIAQLFTDKKGHAVKNAGHYGQAITIRGIVRGMPPVGAHIERMYLESDTFMIPVDASGCPEAIDGITVGCELEVSGTYIIETDNWRSNNVFPQIKESLVAIRTPKDIVLIARPPWWTPGRLIALIAALISVILGIFCWNIALRRRAEQRGKQLADEQLAHRSSELKVLERTRLAVELHDSLSQTLTGISMGISSILEETDGMTPQMSSSLELTLKMVEACRTELRNCLWDLRSMSLEKENMDAAIRLALAQVVSNANVAVRFNVPRPSLPDNTAHAILRIVRELAVNAIRHGKATAIKVAGCIESGKLRFSVCDNGCGFDVETAPGIGEGHFGLQGIRERIERLEGELKIESTAGIGTRVTAIINMPPQNKAKECENGKD